MIKRFIMKIDAEFALFTWFCSHWSSLSPSLSLQGRVCGQGDLSSRPFLLIFDLTECLNPATLLAGCPTPQVIMLMMKMFMVIMIFFLGSRWTFRCAWQPVLQRTFHCWQLWKMRTRRKEKWKRRSNPFAGELFTFKCSQTKGEQTFFAALTSRQRDSQQLLLRSWWREAYAPHGEFCRYTFLLS